MRTDIVVWLAAAGFLLFLPLETLSQDRLLWTNQTLVQSCRYPVIGNVDEFPKEQGGLLEATKGLVCGAFISATLSTIDMFQALNTKNPRLHCAPESASLEQIRLVYMRYMETHPEALHLPSVIGIMAALRDAFPCKKEQ